MPSTDDLDQPWAEAIRPALNSPEDYKQRFEEMHELFKKWCDTAQRLDLEKHQEAMKYEEQLDSYSKVCSDLGKRLDEARAGTTAIQKRENENLEELRALRRFETAVRGALLEYDEKGHVFANSHMPVIMKALSDLNALRGVK